MTRMKVSPGLIMPSSLRARSSTAVSTGAQILDLGRELRVALGQLVDRVVLALDPVLQIAQIEQVAGRHQQAVLQAEHDQQQREQAGAHEHQRASDPNTPAPG